MVYPRSAGPSDDLTTMAGLIDAYVAASSWPLTSAELLALPFGKAGAPAFPIVMAGAEPGQAITEKLIFAQHIPLAEWLVDHADHVRAYLR